MIPEQIAKYLGMTDSPVVMEVEKGAIKRYADAIGHYNPMYLDEDFAADSKYGAIIAPPGFVGWPVKLETVPRDIGTALLTDVLKAGYFVMDGGCEFEFRGPVRAGDTLVALNKMIQLTEKESSGMIVGVMEVKFTNQKGKVVVVRRQTFLCRPQPAKS